MFYNKFSYWSNILIKPLYISVLILTLGLYLNKTNVYQGINIATNSEFNTLLLLIFTIMIVTLVLIIFLNKKTILNKFTTIFIFLLFSSSLFFLIFTNSSLIFFLTYEFLLLLTAYVVNYNSPNVRAKTITLYFTLWTQVSSFILWIAVVFIYLETNSYDFTTINERINHNPYKNIIKYLIFISFSIKLPLWPFSFWLLKTHVEANTSFSIFLSGVLVKTALIGLIKFNFLFVNTNNTPILFIVLIGLISTTFSMSYQVDFKKLIAYTTIQEMTLISMFIIYNSFVSINMIIYFIILHTLMSFLLFGINDIIYIRFKTRRTGLLLGIMTGAPKLSVIIIIIWLIFVSIPMSLKFIFEFLLLLKFFTLPNIILISLIICLQFITIIFFSKNTITFIFGNSNKITYDLTKNELINIIIPIVLISIFIF